MDMLGSHRALGGAVHLASERATGQPHANEQGESLTYNRMEAKLIVWRAWSLLWRCQAPLVKTPCCDQWICCDTAFVSFRGGGGAKWSMNASACVIPTMRISTAARGKATRRREFWSPR